ncbi:MAG: hypothetical protein PHZ19_04595 [Candidatus Thermoplasmatota archaeon]|nr:hypothetical protein [Candidatus Thermoplasmatota archaeon]
MSTLDDFDDDVQYYDHILEQLKHSQKHKVRKFLEHDCIHPADNGSYQVRPIPGYKRTYTVRMGGSPICNCQFSVMERRKGNTGICSHIAAVASWLRGETHG